MLKEWPKEGPRLLWQRHDIGYGYSSFSERMNFATAGTAMRTTDSYGLGGIVPPIAPYAGTFTEASTSNRTTIKAINALVTKAAHGLAAELFFCPKYQ